MSQNVVELSLKGVSQTKHGHIKAVNFMIDQLQLQVKLWLQDSNIEMYSTHKEGKSI